MLFASLEVSQELFLERNLLIDRDVTDSYQYIFYSSSSHKGMLQVQRGRFLLITLIVARSDVCIARGEPEELFLE